MKQHCITHTTATMTKQLPSQLLSIRQSHSKPETALAKCNLRQTTIYCNVEKVTHQYGLIQREVQTCHRNDMTQIRLLSLLQTSAWMSRK